MPILSTLRFSALVGLVLLASPLGATEVEISLGLKSPPGVAPHGDDRPAAILVLSPADTESSHPSRRVELTCPGKAVVDLPVGTWNTTLDTADFWAAAHTLEVGSTPGALAIEAFPAGRIAGSIVVPDKMAPPTVVDLRLEGRGEGDTWRVELECPIAEGRFDCQAPAGLSDLRIAAGDTIPHYLWDVEVPWRETLRLASLTLRSGTSVAGWVSFFEPPEGLGEAKLEEVTLTLAPTLGGFVGRDERRRIEAVSSRALANSRGFFQLQGVAPGQYALIARHPHASAATLPSLLVVEDEETLLEETLELWPPVQLEVRVDPATDPYHQPWTVSLSRPTASLTYWATDRQESVGPQGEVLFETLDRGEVGVALLDSWGSSWGSARLVLEQDQTAHDIDAHLSRLEIALEVGDRPVPRARVVLRDPEQHAQITKIGDENGSVYFFLPLGRRWRAEVEQLELGVTGVFEDLEIPAVEPGERWPKLRLTFPDTTLEGMVVEADGTALLRSADLHIGSSAGASQGRTQPDGSFTLRGLPEGNITVGASLGGPDGRQRLSDTRPADLRQGEIAGPVTLTLGRGGQIEGVVLSPSGQGVAGAFVLAGPATETPGPSFPAIPPQTHTEVDGVFTLALPADVERVLLQVFPPGFVPAQLEVSRHQEGPVVVQVESEGGDLWIHFDRPPEALLHSQPPGALMRHTTVYREGLSVGNALLLASIWNPMSGVRAAGLNPLHFGRLAAGAYTVCWGGGLSPEAEGTCVDGFMPPLGMLEVVIPHHTLVEHQP